jgi:hypothetical protein
MFDGFILNCGKNHQRSMAIKRYITEQQRYQKFRTESEVSKQAMAPLQPTMLTNDNSSTVPEMVNSTEDAVEKPNMHDVLCGRGGNINTHTGNENFRKLIETHKRVYLTARFKKEKRIITDSIIEEISQRGGKFRIRDAKTGLWSPVGIDKSRDKTSQALRENGPELKKKIEQENEAYRESQREKEKEEAIANAAAAAAARTRESHDHYYNNISTPQRHPPHHNNTYENGYNDRRHQYQHPYPQSAPERGHCYNSPVKESYHSTYSERPYDSSTVQESYHSPHSRRPYNSSTVQESYHSSHSRRPYDSANVQESYHSPHSRRPYNSANVQESYHNPPGEYRKNGDWGRSHEPNRYHQNQPPPEMNRHPPDEKKSYYDSSKSLVENFSETFNCRTNLDSIFSETQRYFPNGGRHHRIRSANDDSSYSGHKRNLPTESSSQGRDDQEIWRKKTPVYHTLPESDQNYPTPSPCSQPNNPKRNKRQETQSGPSQGMTWAPKPLPWNSTGGVSSAPKMQNASGSMEDGQEVQLVDGVGSMHIDNNQYPTAYPNQSNGGDISEYRTPPPPDEVAKMDEDNEWLGIRWEMPACNDMSIFSLTDMFHVSDTETDDKKPAAKPKVEDKGQDNDISPVPSIELNISDVGEGSNSHLFGPSLVDVFSSGDIGDNSGSNKGGNSDGSLPSFGGPLGLGDMLNS